MGSKTSHPHEAGDHGHHHDGSGHMHDTHECDTHEHHGHDHSGHDDDHDHDHSGHDHDHSAGHDDHDHAGHDHSHDFTDVNRRSLVIALALIGGFMIAEVVGGLLSGSLALLSDAGHMITDAAAIALALVAQRMAQRDASAERTFGYRRAEVLAAMLNALSLWLIAAWVFFEAYHRIRDVPDVEGGLLLIVGVLGLLVNIAAAWVLHRSAEHSMNVEGAFRHVMADLMGSVGVVISGVVIITLGWAIVDPILSVLIGILILASSWRLTVKVFHVLMEAVPENIDVYALCHELEEQPGVTLVHDVHVWTISSGHESFTAHVLVDPSYEGDMDELIHRMQAIARHSFGIDHITIQAEKSLAGCTEKHHVGHLMARKRARNKKKRFALA
ncbi:MAG: cation diffusion facilitator family transporter [bacterium]|nr:cation diffusion facilitator family transporter [bacterium]